jgi:hypothetical protein
MRRLQSFAVVAVFCFAAAAYASVVEGNWTRPSIENAFPADFAASDAAVLYVTGSGAARTFSWTMSDGAAEAVRVERNKNVSGWELIKFTYNNATFANDTEGGYYAAGYAEGYLTFQGIYYTYLDQVKDNVREVLDSSSASAFLSANMAYVRNHDTSTPFGQQLRKQNRLIDGLAAGWMAYYNEDPSHQQGINVQLGRDHMYYLSYMEGLEDIESKFGVSAEMEALLKRPSKRDHCSALMKLTSTDLYFAHDTWSGFHTMLRQYKTYEFGGTRVSMSGYPGSISSIDDFYVTSNKLAVTETTNNINNNSIYVNMTTTQVPEFHRVMIANFLARTPEEWMGYFKEENSGTYNNQYMVADMAAAQAALDKGEPLPAGTFWVGEQVPGLVVAADQTAFLNEHKHWPSYNIPFYPEIYAMMGYPAINGPEWYGFNDYHNYSRAVIFKRMQDMVTDDVTMWYMMRYNNWQQDPASAIPWCKQNGGDVHCKDTETHSAGLAVAARFDLNPMNISAWEDEVGEAAGDVSNWPSGAIDTKMTSARWVMENSKVVIQNGPSFVQQPIFSWSAYVATARSGPRRSQHPPVWRAGLLQLRPHLRVGRAYANDGTDNAPSERRRR